MHGKSLPEIQKTLLIDSATGIPLAMKINAHTLTQSYV
jgi:hypothetical protein